MSPIEQHIKEKIETVGIPLRKWDVRINRGILTGYNDAFIISTEERNQIIADDPKSAEIIRPYLMAWHGTPVPNAEIQSE